MYYNIGKIMQAKILLNKYEMRFYFLKLNNKWFAVNEQQKKELPIVNKKLIETLNSLYEISVDYNIVKNNEYEVEDIDLEYILTTAIMELEDVE